MFFNFSTWTINKFYIRPISSIVTFFIPILWFLTSFFSLFSIFTCFLYLGIKILKFLWKNNYLKNFQNSRLNMFWYLCIEEFLEVLNYSISRNFQNTENYFFESCDANANTHFQPINAFMCIYNLCVISYLRLFRNKMYLKIGNDLLNYFVDDGAFYIEKALLISENGVFLTKLFRTWGKRFTELLLY